MDKRAGREAFSKYFSLFWEESVQNRAYWTWMGKL